jgi:hypothetical protein
VKLRAPFVMGFTVHALSGCGPLMELRDTFGPTRYGPMTPYGEIKHDFWGNSYIEPYPLPPSRESIRREQDGDGGPKPPVPPPAP